MTQQNNKYAVVGGGMLGLTVAWRLAQQGCQVTVFESAGDIGGLASSWQIDDLTWDKFYHVILMSDSHFRRLLKEIDLDDNINWVETKTGFYTNGQLYSMSNSIEFLKFPPLSLIDKFRLGATIFYASRIKNWKKLEQQYVANWLKKWSGRNTFEKMWLPLLRAKLGENYKETSAAFIWATIARMYAARRSGLKKEMFGYVPGGYAVILEMLKNKLQEAGVNILYDHKLTNLQKNDKNFTLSFENQSEYIADKTILTIPSTHVEKLNVSLSPDELTKHKQIKYLGVVCASFLLKKPISPYYVTNITDDNTPFTGIIEMSALVNKEHLKGHNLVYLPKYVSVDDPVWQQSDEFILDYFKESLLKMYPHLKNEDISTGKIARAKQVFALSTINYSQNVPPSATSVPGLFIVNSAHIVNGTLNVNETVHLAEKTVHKILES